MGHRDWRGDCFLKLLYSYKLHLPHTFVEGFDLRFTCFNNGKSDPKQIDYMATTAAKKWIVQAKVAESCATDSDHWPLSLGLLPKTPKCRQAAKSEGKQYKPINWQPAEIDYNDKIREGVGTERPVDVAEIAQNAYHIFTDGSFTGHRSHQGRHKNRAPRNNLPPTPCKAGWGVAFFDRGPEPTDTWEAWEHIGRRLEGKAGTKMEQFNGTLQGRVTTTAEWEQGALGHVGARKKTNNTAEIQAVIETLFFLLAQLDEADPLIKPKQPIVIHSDSRYAVDIIRNGTRSTTNSVIRNIMTHLWKRTREAYDIRIEWVRGHAKNVGNELADKLAGEGADEKIDEVGSRWRPRDWGFSAFRRNNPKSFATHFSEDSFHHEDGPWEEDAEGARRGPTRSFADIDTQNNNAKAGGGRRRGGQQGRA